MMSQFERGNRRVERPIHSTGKDFVSRRRSTTMKKSSLLSYRRRKMEEWQLIDAECLVSGGHSEKDGGSPVTPPSSQGHVRHRDGALEPPQGHVRRLVEKFRKLGEPVPNTMFLCQPPHGRRKQSGGSTEGQNLSSAASHRRKESFTSYKRRSGCAKQFQAKNEEWTVILAPNESCLPSGESRLPMPRDSDKLSPADSSHSHLRPVESYLSASNLSNKSLIVGDPPASADEPTLQPILSAIQAACSERRTRSEDEIGRSRKRKSILCGRESFCLGTNQVRELCVQINTTFLEAVAEAGSHTPEDCNATGDEERRHEGTDAASTAWNCSAGLNDSSSVKVVTKTSKCAENSDSCAADQAETESEKMSPEQISCPVVKENTVLLPVEISATKPLRIYRGDEISDQNPPPANRNTFLNERPCVEIEVTAPSCIFYDEEISSLSAFTAEKTVINVGPREEINIGTGPNLPSDCNYTNLTHLDNLGDIPEYSSLSEWVYEEVNVTPSSGVLCHPEKTSDPDEVSKNNLQADPSQDESYYNHHSDLHDYDVVCSSEVHGIDLQNLNGNFKESTGNKASKSVWHVLPVICIAPDGAETQVCAGASEPDVAAPQRNHDNSKDSDENVYEDFDFSLRLACSEPDVRGRSEGVFAGGLNQSASCNGLGVSSGSVSSGSILTTSAASSAYDSFSSTEDDEESKPTDPAIQAAEERISTPVSQLERIILEIVETEIKYLERLKLINEEFRLPLLTWNQEKRLIPNEVMRQIFLNSDIIYKLHGDFFLPELEACTHADKSQGVEDVFLKGADFLKLYAEYSCNFSDAMKAIALWKTRVPEFSRVIQEIQRKPVCRSLTLEHHMLEVILRIPRYELLLNKYHDHLPAGTPEKDKTQKALMKVVAAASHCNDFIKSMEKYHKVMDVQQSLWGKTDLVTPTRELILSGRMKVTQQLEQDEEKVLFLFNDTLLVCKILPRAISPPYKLTLQLDVSSMQVVDRKREEAETFFVIGKQGYLELHPSTLDEKEKWISAIKTVIKNYHTLEETRKAATASRNQHVSRQKSIPGTRAPIWIRDSLATHCMQCQERFNAIRRRHHCRACGILVCGKCSSKQSHLEFDSYSQQHRVCDRCFSEILKSKEQDDLQTKIVDSLSTTDKMVQLPTSSELTGLTDPDGERQANIFTITTTEKSVHQHPEEEDNITRLSSSLEAIITQ